MRRRPGRLRAILVGLLAASSGAVAAAGDDGPATLVEATEPGRRARVVASLEADGRFLPGPGADGRPAEPIALTLKTRLDYVEQVLEVDADGRPRRSSRRVDSGTVAIGGDDAIRASTVALRPEVASLVAEVVEGDGGGVVVASPGGPLSRSELELVQLPADPLALPALLPAGPVAEGDRWPLPDPVAASISGYDRLASQTLEATLRSVDADAAEVEIKGRIEGAALGGSGGMDVEGAFRFDRKAARVASLSLRRDERREPGPVEAGLEFRSVLAVERSDAPEGEVDGLVQRVPEALPERWLLLSYATPDGRYRLEHDRSWYVVSEDDRQSVLRRLDGGLVVAQADLIAGPTVEPGARPKADRFRDDVRKALGDRFDRFIDVGQVAAPPGEARTRLAIAGRQGDEPIVWYYYLVADPSGRQLVAIFTMRASAADRLGRRDQRMIESLRWLGPGGGPPSPAAP